MNFLKGNNENAAQAQTGAGTQEAGSGGGGIMGKVNSALGGGAAGEKNEGDIGTYMMSECGVLTRGSCSQITSTKVGVNGPIFILVSKAKLILRPRSRRLRPRTYGRWTTN